MRRPPDLLVSGLDARVSLLATTLNASTVRRYNDTVRSFFRYLHQSFPEVRRPDQLRRDPHMLGWFEYLWSGRGNRSGKPWAKITRGACLLCLRKLLDLLADHAFPPRPGLILSQDIPRPDQLLPRPLTPEDDVRLITELRRRNDWLSNALLLTRWTGTRIGETADLAVNCLRHLGGEQWALHVPVGKLHNDRLVPVDEQVREVVARLRFFRTLEPAAPPEFLLPRRKGHAELCAQLRAYFTRAATDAGIVPHIVPHQMRHTFATTMLRAGISVPALMKLLGHRTANMTLRYVEITQQDLQREFHLARQHPRHRIPLPSSAAVPDVDAADAAAVVQRLSAAVRVLDLYRQQNPSTGAKPLQLLLRRLVRVRSRFQKLSEDAESEK
jgi:integrase